MANIGNAKKPSKAQKVALEKQLVREGKILPRYAPKNYMGRIIAVLLAFVLGIGAAIGGLFGVGFFAVSRPMKDVFGLFGLDYKAYLTEHAANMSMLDAGQALFGGGINTLDDIAEFTPYVDTLLDAVDTQLAEVGISVDRNEFKATPFDQMGAFLSDTIQTVELAGVLKVDAHSDPIMIALCYGAEGSNEDGGDYTLDENGEIVMNEGKTPTRISTLTNGATEVLGKVTVESALSINASSNSAMRYLAYGTEGESYIIVPPAEEGGSPTVEMLTDPMTGEKYKKKSLNDLTQSADLMGDATLGDVIEIKDDTTGLLAAIREWTISDLSESSRFERLRLDQLLTIDENASSIMKAMKDWRISDLKDQDKINSLCLGDVLVIDDSSAAILRALRDTRLGDLSTASNELSLTEILGAEAVESNKLLKPLAASTVATLSDDIKNLTVADVYGDELYSYLDLTAGKTYAEYIENYNPEDPASVRPNAIKAQQGTSIAVTETRTLASGTAVLEGWFREDGASHLLVPDGDVRRDAEGHFTRVKIAIQPTQFAWTFVDYANAGTLTQLPADDLISAEQPVDGVITVNGIGYTVEQNGRAGTPLLENELPLYYLTSRVLPAEQPTPEPTPEQPTPEPTPGQGDPVPLAAGETQYVAYPIYTDGNGVFYRQRTLSDGASYSSVLRIDLERIPTAYGYVNGGEVTFDDQGNVLYGEQGQEQHLPLLSAKEADGSTSYFVRARIAVERKLYTGTEGDYTFYDEQQVTFGWTATWTDEAGMPHTDVPVDRYLAGFWYVLFGEECNGDAGCTHGESGFHIVDKSNTPILEIAPAIGNSAGTLNDLPLYKLWLHEIIAEDPFVELLVPFPVGDTQKDNLNELTVSEVISYVKLLIEQTSQP